MSYPIDERETTLVYDDETKTWSMYSTVPKHIRRLAKLCDLTVIESENGTPIAVKGVLSEKQVSMRKLIKLTEEQRQAAAERLSKVREAHKGQEI